MNIERALMSTISQDPAVIGSEVLSVFQRDNPFEDDVVKRIYFAWSVQPDRNTWNTTAILDKLEQSAFKCDWLTELRSVMNTEPSVANWRAHLEHVRREYTRRQATKELQHALHTLEGAEDVQGLLTDVSKRIVSIDTSNEEAEVDMEQEVRAELARLENGERFSCGIPSVDEIIGPMEPGEVYTVAARTGVGKSLMAVNIVRHMSIMNDIPGLYFSFEMNPSKHIARIVASLTHYNSKEVLELYRDGQQDVVDMYKRVYASPIYWDKRPRLSPAQIVNKVRRFSRNKGIKYAIIDHTGFVRLGAGKSNELLGEFIKDFKAVCTEEGVVPILLVQINRSATESETGVGLHHMKGSGAYEEDSSQVLLLDREITLTEDERQRVRDGRSLPLKAAGAKSRYDMTGFKQLALFLHSSLIQDREIDEREHI